MMLEVTPPPRRAKPESVETAAEQIRKAVENLGNVDYINVPEVTEENHAGVPLYKNMDSSEYASLLWRKTKIDMVVNKITPHFPSEAAFRSWLQDWIAKYNIRHLVLVGGSSGARGYPGPAVIRANEIAKELGKGRVSIGNICIPSRPEEAERLVAKTRAGASFFTTQMIFEPKSMEKVLEEYATKCEDAEVAPATFFVSFAPASSHYDIDFFKWLGAEIPADTEAELRKSADLATASVLLAAGIYSRIADFVNSREMNLELAPNVEAVSAANLEYACRIIDEIRKAA